ncbi:MAG TPA: phospholipase D-like domain-containing protein [Longimicrobiaceae bacterium]|nr:phospholipase D-like domain-containing protein [Longimicrobiaceae bacterium]
MISTILLLSLLGFLLLLTKQYLMQGTAIREIRLLGEDPEEVRAGTPLFLERYSDLTGTRFSDSARVELLCNGDELFPRLFADLRAARRLIALQIFWYKPGKLADVLHDVLAERARAGVRVLVLLDYFGSYGLGEDYVRSLTAAGVEVAVYRPLRWETLYKVQQRSHVRAVVVDGCVGYTGGFGIDDDWSGDGRHPGQWRDTHVRVEGPVVDRLQGAFVTNWAEATGDLLLGGGIFAREGGGDGGGDADVRRAGITFCSPSLGSTTAERAFVLTIAGARQRLYVTNAYFVPDENLRGLLCEAAGRGVDVRVLTPGLNTDRRSAYYAGRAHYEELLDAGVRIYEYEPTMVHAKTMVVDGAWSLVGTINFDTRSMALNEEVALAVADERFAARLEAVFLADLRHAKEVSAESLRGRSVFERMKERAALLVAPLL